MYCCSVKASVGILYLISIKDIKRMCPRKVEIIAEATVREKLSKLSHLDLCVQKLEDVGGDVSVVV
jgi:hypothetical protein